MNNSAMMISKVKNIYIMLLYAISKENISMVDHYLDDALTLKIKNYIDHNKSKSIKQVFRQQNISDIRILEENDNNITIEANIKHITYFVDRKTNKYIDGDKQTRIENTLILKFKKKDIETKSVILCPTCGAGLKINNSGICSYCGEALDERFSEYVLYSIE